MKIINRLLGILAAAAFLVQPLGVVPVFAGEAYRLNPVASNVYSYSGSGGVRMTMAIGGLIVLLVLAIRAKKK